MRTLLPPVTDFRPTACTIDLAAIRHNVRALAPPRAQMMAVVKANGYGHGAEPVARAALAAGATWLGVALVEEGIRLRDAGIVAPILVLTQFPPGSEGAALGAGLTPTVYTSKGLARLAAAAAGRSIGVHVKVDTGMHRVGLDPARAVEFVADATRMGLEIEGLWTHFAASEELGDPFTGLQLERFADVVASVRSAGVRPRYLHAANSAAAMAVPASHFDIVRLGLAIYGLPPAAGLPGAGALRPAMRWTSKVAAVRRLPAGERISYGLRYRLDRVSTIATVPVGYADGYSRLLSETGEVLIGGRRRRIAGTVTMDQLMVDCGDDPVAEGDDVVLMGRQGDEEITAEELAARIGTANYEVVCQVSERVPRRYEDPDAA